MGDHVEMKRAAASEIPKSVHCCYSANGIKHACWGTEVPSHKTQYTTLKKTKGTNIKVQNLNRKVFCASMQGNFSAVDKKFWSFC
jgi:hypothetical protein